MINNIPQNTLSSQATATPLDTDSNKPADLLLSMDSR